MRRPTLYAATLLALVAITAVVTAQTSALLDEDFDDGQGSVRWAESVGASSGNGPTSRVTWAEGAVALTADEGTTQWALLTHDIDVAGASWIRVTANLRADGLDLDRARYINANVFIRHGRQLTPSRIVAGTTGWTIVRRRVELPPDTTTVTVGLFASVPGTLWFDDIRVEPAEAPQWQEEVDGPYRYFWLPDDEIPAEARSFNAAAFERVRQYLDVPVPPEPVPYFKYPDLDAMEELYGRRGNAFRDGGTVHSIWATDAHEIVHVLADAWGDPPALLAEGLAVFLSGGWQGEPVTDYAAGLLASGDWLPLDTIVTSAVFRQHPDLVAYAAAGALVAWLDEVHGRDAVRAVYGALDNSGNAEANESAFTSTLGISVGEADARVRAWLAAGSGIE